MRSFTRRSGYAVEHKLPQRLLKAALLKDERAIQAWQSLVDENDLDEASHRLFPLLYQNLSQLGVNPDEIKKYKQAYRFYWYKNQLIISKAAPILQALDQAGIDYLLLKGIPLAFHYYSNTGLRPFLDVDILVRPADALQAYTLLKQNDLTPSINYPEEKLLQLRHSQDLRTANGLTIDLHWQLLERDWGSQSQMAFWDDTVVFMLGARTAHTLNASAHLMHACLHGLNWSFVAPVRWAADAAVLINVHAEKIDWDWIIHQAEIRRLTIQLNHQLHYLRTSLDQPIPHHVIQSLAAARHWRWEKLETRLASRPPHIFTKLLGFWFLHSRAHPAGALWANLTTFPQFLLDILHIQRTKDIFPTFFRKLKEWV